MTEQTILRQLIDAQKATDARLDKLIQLQADTNAWLAQVAALLGEKTRA